MNGPKNYTPIAWTQAAVEFGNWLGRNRVLAFVGGAAVLAAAYAGGLQGRHNISQTLTGQYKEVQLFQQSDPEKPLLTEVQKAQQNAATAQAAADAAMAQARSDLKIAPPVKPGPRAVEIKRYVR